MIFMVAGAGVLQFQMDEGFNSEFRIRARARAKWPAGFRAEHDDILHDPACRLLSGSGLSNLKGGRMDWEGMENRKSKAEKQFGGRKFEGVDPLGRKGKKGTEGAGEHDPGRVSVKDSGS